MSFSNAAEVASRAGVVQQATPKAPRTTQQAESAHQNVSWGESEEFSLLSADSTPTNATSGERRLSRREARRRREAEGDAPVQNDAIHSNEDVGESGGRSRTSDAKGTRKTGKKSRLQKRRGADWTPERGLKTAQNLLNQQGLMAQASVQFEQNRAPQAHKELTPFGQQQAMLDSLISMTECLYQQHTGDKAGEIYNRPACRQILTALRGLKDQAQGVEGEVSNPVLEVAPKKRKKREFMAQMRRIERVHVALNPVQLPEDYEPLDLVA